MIKNSPRMIMLLALSFSWFNSLAASTLTINNRTEKSWVYVTLYFRDQSSQEYRLNTGTNRLQFQNSIRQITSIEIYEKQLPAGPKYTRPRNSTTQNKIEKTNLVTITKRNIRSRMTLTESNGSYRLR